MSNPDIYNLPKYKPDATEFQIFFLELVKIQWQCPGALLYLEVQIFRR